MRTWIVLLRGINVGGKNRLKMKDLTACFEQAGAQHVTTYVQSGNVMLDWPDDDAAALESVLGQAIRERFGLDVSVMVREQDSWHALIAQNPYVQEAHEDPGRVHVICLNPQIDVAHIDHERLLRACTTGERYHLTPQALYVHYPDGSGRSRLSHALCERVLGVSCTARNWRTVMACARLCHERETHPNT